MALSRSDSYDSAPPPPAGDLARSKVNFSESVNFNKGTGYDLSGELIYNHKFLSRPRPVVQYPGPNTSSDSEIARPSTNTTSWPPTAPSTR